MKKKAKNILMNTLCLLIGCVWCIPVYYLVVTTFKTPAEATASPLGLPKVLAIENYVKAYDAMNYLQSLRNNIIITASSVALLIVFSAMAAYAVARSKKKITKLIYALFLIGLTVPYQVSIIPLYRIVTKMGLMNTFPGIILVNVFCINLPLSVFLLRSFVSTIPQEIEEAAYIDGAGVFRTFWVIVFPLMKPVIATVTILDALAVWNDFMTPLLFLQDPKKNVLLQQVYKNVGPFSTNWTSFFPMLVLATLPLVIFYIFMSKNIMDGVVAGSVKG